jgi:quinohemoprotein ethanol dehydrogenase
VALDADTGRYLWHYQETPGDAWDYDSTADMVLATLSLQGQSREVILHAPKNGFFYVLDRASGKLISAAKDEKVTWATRIDMKTGRPVEVPAARYRDQAVVVWPGDLGVHNWHPMAYSPKTRWAYIPMIHGADVYGDEGIDTAAWMPAPHRWNFGVASQHKISAPVQEFSSSLAAWDPVHQRLAWRTTTPGRAGGGVLATAADLVFQGHVDGRFAAYDAQRGRPLWSFQADSAIFGAPISYAVDGRQYIAVLSGPPAAGMAFGGQPAWRYQGPRRLLVFSLGGTQRLPAPLPAPEPVRTASVSSADPLVIAAGGALYNQECVVCHGPNVKSGGGAPDLRASSLPLDPMAFSAVLHEGALQSRGMPRFAEFSPQQLEQLRSYIRAAAGGANPRASDVPIKP